MMKIQSKMSDTISSIFLAVMSRYVAQRDELNSDIIRHIEKACEDPNYKAIIYIEDIITQLSIVEKRIETTQGLHQRFMLKNMSQELGEKT